MVKYKKVTSNLNLLAEKAGWLPRLHEEEVRKLQTLFPMYAVEFGSIFDINPSTRKDLLVLSRSDLIPYWRDEASVLASITRCSQVSYKWYCDTHEVEYFRTPCEQVLVRTGCDRCRVLSPERVELSKLTIGTGALTANYIAEQLRTIETVLDVIETGQIGNAVDDLGVILKADGLTRAVQVKTLSVDSRRPSVFGIHVDRNRYHPQMLLVATDARRTVFFVAYVKDILTDHPNLTFTSKARKYQEFKYYNVQDMLTAVARLLPGCVETSQITNRYSPNYAKEVAMRERLQAKCKHLGYKWTEPANNCLPIDGYINGHAVQLKWRGNKCVGRSTYLINLSKNAGFRTHQPYSDNDGIEFFIFELGCSAGRFLIIPLNVLLDDGCIRTETQPGKTFLYLTAPGTSKKYEAYWDNWALLL